MLDHPIALLCGLALAGLGIYSWRLALEGMAYFRRTGQEPPPDTLETLTVRIVALAIVPVVALTLLLYALVPA